MLLTVWWLIFARHPETILSKLSWPGPATGGEPSAYKTIHCAQSGQKQNECRMSIFFLSTCHALNHHNVETSEHIDNTMYNEDGN